MKTREMLKNRESERARGREGEREWVNGWETGEGRETKQQYESSSSFNKRARGVVKDDQQQVNKRIPSVRATKRNCLDRERESALATHTSSNQKSHQWQKWRIENETCMLCGRVTHVILRINHFFVSSHFILYLFSIDWSAVLSSSSLDNEKQFIMTIPIYIHVSSRRQMASV